MRRYFYTYKCVKKAHIDVITATLSIACKIKPATCNWTEGIVVKILFTKAIPNVTNVINCTFFICRINGFPAENKAKKPV